MKKFFLFLLGFVLLAFTACNNDDDSNNTPISVSFANPSQNIPEGATTVQILFSNAASGAGSVTLSLNPNAVSYGTDFTTLPASSNNVIVVPFEAGAKFASFTFNKIIEGVQGEPQRVIFTITDVSLNATIAGNKTTQLNFSETASLGTALAALTGGATQPNQVYVDLSSGGLATVPRVSWDLGFYGGDEFRIVLNSSLKMAAKALNTTDIDLVASEDSSLNIGQGQGNLAYIDNPVGNIDGTAIAAVSDNDANNKVYLVNLGNGPAATQPAVGSEGSAGGAHRGWKKIRILKSGSDYKLQYADINATTHQEVTITKNNAYNFTFFSFTTNNTVNVEPQKVSWDINFTTFTNVVGPTTPYYFADFIVTNTKGGAHSYQVLNSATVNYDNFTLANVNESLLTEDQRNIGSNWRTTTANPDAEVPTSAFSLFTNRFYVIKDPAGNVYKLKLTGATSESGERGYPKFQYALLQ
ncbi:HmuY family protein [Flavobacterium psychrotrophum]|uniref:HmuY family protein n=1 Tax=Flavobacterium psychrotrophum TaxID=2294119 RepID=UPI000E3196B1|nr:HmuY family protein [Flavobacterium psychrotrophum]